MKRCYILLLWTLLVFVSGCDMWDGVTTEGYVSFHRMTDDCVSSEDYGFVSENGYQRLLYYRGELLCWKWECVHLNRGCPAFYRQDAALLDVDKKGRLILLEGYSNDAAERNLLRVWRIDPQLHRKELIQTFILDVENVTEVIWSGWCIEGNMLYAEARVSRQEDRSWLRSMLLLGDLRSGESKTYIPPQEGQERISFQGVENGKIYWKSNNQSLWYLDQEVKQLYQGSQDTWDLLLLDHWIIYIETREGQMAMYSYDLDTGRETQIGTVQGNAELFSAADPHQFYVWEKQSTKTTVRLYDMEGVVAK